MIIPRKLQVVYDADVLNEVANELDLDIRDVKRTYDIWLDFLDHIANETDQATITIPKIGQMYVCVSKMRRGLHSDKLKKFKERKLNEIKETTKDCRYCVHEKSVPIILKYGLSKKNIFNKDEKDIPKFFTKEEIVQKQNSFFFKEDKDYQYNEKLKKLFLNE